MTPIRNYLTPRQKQILEFIGEFRRENGFSPTHREICARFGFTSYGTVHKHLKLLESKGFLRRDWNQKRGVELVGSAFGAGDGAAFGAGDGAAFGAGSGAAGSGEAPAVVSFLGRIAAGKPIEALRDEETLQVPQQLLRGAQGDHFVLRVVGDSMIEEGIHDGDLVVVQRRDSATRGDMVVALIDDEATLKRFYPEGDRVRLQPANRTMTPLLLPADKVRVQGVAVGLMRRF